jgi:hypothetical protein
MAYDGYASLRLCVDRGVAFVTIDHPPINLMDSVTIADRDRRLRRSSRLPHRLVFPPRRSRSPRLQSPRPSDRPSYLEGKSSPIVGSLANPPSDAASGKMEQKGQRQKARLNHVVQFQRSLLPRLPRGPRPFRDRRV